MGFLIGNPVLRTVSGAATWSASGSNQVYISGTGDYTLTVAQIGGSSQPSTVSAQFTVAPGPPTLTSFTTHPADAQAGVAISPGIVVELKDSAGNLATDSTATVTLTVYSFSGPGGSSSALEGSVSVAAVGGVATFAAVKGTLAGDYVLKAAAGAAEGLSNTFTISAGAAARLAFSGQPSSALGGTAFGGQPVVEVTDAGGNTVTDSVTVVLSISTAASAGASTSLGGTASQATNLGVADFSANGVSVDKVGEYVPASCQPLFSMFALD